MNLSVQNVENELNWKFSKCDHCSFMDKTCKKLTDTVVAKIDDPYIRVMTLLLNDASKAME